MQNRQKKLVFKASKASQVDKILEHAPVDEIALQRIANFEALLPFLGTQKARVENKPSRNEVRYDPG
jgi:hypothetical protein